MTLNESSDLAHANTHVHVGVDFPRYYLVKRLLCCKVIRNSPNQWTIKLLTTYLRTDRDRDLYIFAALDDDIPETSLADICV